MKDNIFYPEAAVFDMDGLMFDSERVVQHSWNIVGERMGYGRLGDDNIRHTLGFNRMRRRQYFLDKYGKDFPYDSFQEQYGLVYHDYAAEHGIPMKQGLYEILDVLEARGIKKAVATSSSRDHAFSNLERAGIRGRFEAVLTGDMVTEGKPSPEIYLRACKLIETEPARAMALEDAPNGILSAHRAGMYTVLVPDLAEDFDSILPFLDRRAESLSEVAHWLREL
ncbi:MAG: HAD family phosphatase [Eubacteriales bacterium]|nr:HAD family phosphatase [Eubacteriales bacterium]